MTQCTATSKRTKERCQQQAMHGSKVCYHHGGKTPKGIASPHAKHLRYSPSIPIRLLARYQESEQDTELLNLKAEISLLDARLADLLRRVDSGEAGSLWEKARKMNQEIQKAISDENYGRTMVACLELDRLIGDAMTDYAAWAEVESLLDQRRKLVESERKRLVEMQQMVKADEAMTLATALLEAVRRNVTDRGVLTAVQADFNRLLTAGARADG